MDEDKVLCNTYQIKQHKQNACWLIWYCYKKKQIKKKIQDKDKEDKNKFFNISKEYQQ